MSGFGRSVGFRLFPRTGRGQLVFVVAARYVRRKLASTMENRELLNYFVKTVTSGLILLGSSLMISSAYAEMYTNTSMSLGYRTDTLNWSIAGNSSGNNPNVLSELSWKNLESAQINIESDISFDEEVYLRSYINYGYIYDGEVQDSDYNGNNRTGEFSRSLSDAGSGYVGDASIGIGYEIWTIDRSVGRNLRIIPMLGYSFSRQSLEMTKGYQVIPASGAFSGLDSSYQADWYGPWAGVDLWFESSDENYVILRMEYHRADYYAKANWNLRSELQHPVSFEHDATGTGYIVSLGWHHTPKYAWQYSVRLDYQRWQTDAGLARMFFNDPQPACGGSTQCDTQLNGVNWRSFALSVKARLPF